METINIFPNHVKAKFSEDEANQLVGLLLKITRKAKTHVNNLSAQISYHQGRKTKILELQDDINREVQSWSEKVSRLGTTPMSLWKVKIPATKGIDFQWEFPKDSIEKLQ